MKNLLLLVFLFFAFDIQSQELTEAWQSESNFRKNGMLVLGSWATLNIITGIAGRANTSGARSRFYEMNAIWNTVNLGIAIFGYIGAQNLDMTASAFELYKEQNKLDKILLFNAGLDLAYIATGLYLRERSFNSSNGDLLLGYGNSIILQGSFLFLFDIGMVLLHQKIKIGENSFLELQSLLPGQLGLSFTF